jgi:hypothetical protein
MKRLLMLAALAAIGLVGCKSTEQVRLEKGTPMMGANAKAPNGNVVQTSYRAKGTQGVQQAGGVTPAGGGVVQAGGSANVTCCPTGTCPTGACAAGACPIGVCPNGSCATGACATGTCDTSSTPMNMSDTSIIPPAR